MRLVMLAETRSCTWKLIAVGLGAGAAVALTPGTASADGLDFQISIDGYDLLPTAGNSATATSDTGDFAIAWGDGAHAQANDGLGDFALALGHYADAFAGGGNSDTAVDIGDNTDDYTHFVIAGVGNNDVALVDADKSSAISGGNFLEEDLTGSNDTALIVDPFSVGNDMVNAGDGMQPGSFDFGATLFDDNVTNQGATGADYLYDIITTLGQETNAAAATAASWLAELAALL